MILATWAQKQSQKADSRPQIDLRVVLRVTQCRFRAHSTFSVQAMRFSRRPGDGAGRWGVPGVVHGGYPGWCMAGPHQIHQSGHAQAPAGALEPTNDESGSRRAKTTSPGHSSPEAQGPNIPRSRDPEILRSMTSILRTLEIHDQQSFSLG